MVHIACCGHIELDGAEGSVQELLERCARETGIDAYQIHTFDNPLDAIEAAVGSKAEAIIDLLVCASDLPGLAGLQLVRELRDDGYAGHVIICARDNEGAIEAFALGVDGFMVEPVTADRLALLVSATLRKVVQDQADSIELRVREGLRRIRLPQLMYAETDSHNQNLHLLGGESFSIRLSSQALFDLLEPSGLFFKAGSSYIVNYRAVRTLDPKASVALMMDGTRIPIPGRVRKALEDAILA